MKILLVGLKNSKIKKSRFKIIQVVHFVSVIFKPETFHGIFILKKQEATPAHRKENITEVQAKSMTARYIYLFLHSTISL